MRLSRFFIDAPLSLGEHDLPEAQAHYIGRVLRMAPGDACGATAAQHSPDDF